jgi:hypothetical protein
VIPPDEIGVTFEDIGALENVKETLKELVMLPLQRPELFSKGQLMKVCIYHSPNLSFVKLLLEVQSFWNPSMYVYLFVEIGFLLHFVH